MVYLIYNQAVFGRASLEDILSFTMGLRQIPLIGLIDHIKIEFLNRSHLPMAEASFFNVEACNYPYDTLFERNQGILNSLAHFGQV